PSNRPLSRRFRRALEHAGETQDDRLPTYFEWCAPEATWALLEPDFRKEASPEEVRAPLRDFIRTLPQTATLLDRMLALECRFFLADHNLNYTDKMAMAHGVEVRVPFLDRDLAALAASIPDSLRIRRGVPKWILRKALENDLPPEILRRPKTGFGVPLRAWLRGPLRACVDALLHPENLRRRGIFNPDAVRALVHADRAGRIDAAYTILGLICIEMWCRNFLDHPKSLSGSA
ncbi:MAG: asparagine synthase-related protein, partial [Planctomycetota bacterium]